MPDRKTETTNEAMARAVCRAWGIDPDARRWDGSDNTFMQIGWHSADVQKFVAGFLACSEVMNNVR